MATKDGRAQIWYADGSGNVAGYTESVGDIAGTIIDTYNEHFGTDISIWTPETKTLQVGGTVPNWNAYEKIGIILIAIRTAAGQVTCEPGYIQNNIIHMFGKSAEEKILVVLVENGLVVAESGWSQTIENFLFQSVRTIYENVSDNIVIDDSPYNINDNIENWNSFEIIEPI